MTASFTTMLLTAVSCFGQTSEMTIGSNMEVLASAADAALDVDLPLSLPSRVVFLGSGPYQAIARESALKVLELSAGKIIALWDSTLGFRHGPKAVVDEGTVIVVYLSSDQLTRKYDNDLVVELRDQYPNATTVTIGTNQPGMADPNIPMHGTGNDLWDSALYVLIAQRLAVKWSKALGLNVDNPFENGTLTRVVAGVRLHA